MARKKYNVDSNALHAIKVLLDLKEVANWTKAKEAYSDLTGVEIPADVLRRRAKNLTAENLNTIEVEKYLKSYNKQNEFKVQYDPNKELIIGETVFKLTLDNGTKTIQQSLGISEKDKKEKFGILDTDTPLEQKQKIMNKLGDGRFLVETVLGLDPNLYELASIEPGAWSVPMKLRSGNQDVPIIVTSDRIGITIKRKKHIDKDYLDVSKQVIDYLEKKVPKIQYPDMKVAKKAVRNKKDILITQHINDLHFGGLTHYLDTSFDNWDSKKAAKVLHEITRYTIDRQVNEWNSRTLYICINGDLFDIDNLFNKTSSMSQHTMQTDNRWNKIYSDGLAIIMYSLVRLSPYFDDIFVDFNRGNHDKQSMDALYLNIATGILMSSKLKNIHIDFDKSGLFKESYYTWGRHLFLSTHGELKDKTLVSNLEVKFSDLMRRHPYVNIMAGHTHQASMNFYGDKMVFRDPSPSPVTAFESETMALNGKAVTAQIFRKWEKEKRMPQTEVFEFERRKLWKDKEDDTVSNEVSSMEELQKYMFTQGIMRPTHKQIELAHYYNDLLKRVRNLLRNKGIDTSKIDIYDAVEMAETLGLKLPIELRHEDAKFVQDNLRKILRS